MSFWERLLRVFRTTSEKDLIFRTYFTQHQGGWAVCVGEKRACELRFIGPRDPGGEFQIVNPKVPHSELLFILNSVKRDPTEEICYRCLSDDNVIVEDVFFVGTCDGVTAWFRDFRGRID